MTNKLLSILLLFSVCINVGLFSKYLERPGAGEDQASVSAKNGFVVLAISDGHGYPVSVGMKPDQARAFAQAMVDKAGEAERVRLPGK